MPAAWPQEDTGRKLKTPIRKHAGAVSVRGHRWLGRGNGLSTSEANAHANVGDVGSDSGVPSSLKRR
ncbi:hypothetical protein CPLU01_13331 [Colletotrichum plurivorum]|uniref:Uncharacterized protein n=1 Tax=Colletotrichum plurivorum TaxID=2175906 RepID=A0A8H6JS77_9PEZI|nr:hypothetical protein CPLU01_13331 [Colletotrichum plurivorum]